jgi:cell division topological specificity factor
MISTLLDRLFPKSNAPSGVKVKQRLKFILAHDRAAIEPQIFENMRHEIMRVVSKYVELDEGSLDIRLESDKRMTALIANLPIRMVREEMPDLIPFFGEDGTENDSKNEASDLVNSDQNDQDESDPLATEMDLFAEAALDAIAAKENTSVVKSNQVSENITPESIAIIGDRTIEVTSKLRIAANKSLNSEVANSEVANSEVADLEAIDNKKEAFILEADATSILDDNDGNAENEKQINGNIVLEESSNNQLELLIESPNLSESQEVVIDESPELYHQSK